MPNNGVEVNLPLYFVCLASSLSYQYNFNTALIYISINKYYLVGPFACIKFSRHACAFKSHFTGCYPPIYRIWYFDYKNGESARLWTGRRLVVVIYLEQARCGLS